MSEIASFYQFLTQRLAQFGDSTTTPEEVLDMWRLIHPAATEFDANVEAIREALHDMESGDRGTSLETFDAGFRARHEMP